MKKILSFAVAIVAVFSFAVTAQAGGWPDLSSYSSVSGSAAAGPNQVAFSAAHAENQGFAAACCDFAIATNTSSGYAVQHNGIAQFNAGGHASIEKDCYGCFDTSVGAGAYSEVGGAAFNQHNFAVVGADAVGYAGLDYGWYSVETYADGASSVGALGNGAGNAGYWSYANVNN